MIEHNLLIGKLYELNLSDDRRKLLVSRAGKVMERIGSRETFVLLDIRDNTRDNVLILEILTSTGNVGMTAVYLEELKMVN